MSRIFKETLVKATKAYKKKTEIFICDFCKKQARVSTCVICKRDVCYGGYDKSCVQFDPHEIGDYPDRYCPTCYDLRFVKYESEFEKIAEERVRTEDLLIEKIRKLSLKS